MDWIVISRGTEQTEFSTDNHEQRVFIKLLI